MRSYPAVIDARVLEINAHISDEEITRDIADTEAEILNEEKRVEGQRLLCEAAAHGSAEHKMADFRYRAYLDGLTSRREFVAFLRRLQSARSVPT